MKKHQKLIMGLQILLVACLLIIIISSIVLYAIAKTSYDPDREIVFGITFSKKFAQQLQLDWKETYLAMLDDLEVKYLRIPTYWDEIEPVKGYFDFADIDWQLSEAAKKDVKVILVLGRRQPRWPECHDPKWVELEKTDEVRKQVLNNIEQVITRYKDNKTIEMWQVENEPFLNFFGECPKIKEWEVVKQIDLVRSLDSRPVLITDSGELSTWYPSIKLGDYFGTTLYRTTWNKYIGYWQYFFVPASYYRVKAFLFGKSLSNVFIAELQAEPWFPNNPLDTPLPDHYKTMNAQKLIQNAEYAKQTNLPRAYFWGVEWWYWLKKLQGDDTLWLAAKQIIKN